MRDGQDDLERDDLERGDLNLGAGEQPAPRFAPDMHDWLDAAIRAKVDTQYRFHKAWPAPDAELSESPEQLVEPERVPEPQSLTAEAEVADRIESVAPPPPPPVVRLRDRGVTPAPPLRRSLDPVRVPLPKPSSRQRRPGPLLIYGPIIGGAAAVAYGIAVWGSPSLHNVTVADARPVVVDAQTETPLAPRLIIHDQHVMTNEPLPLEIVVDQSVPNASLRMAGLASGTRMSAGSALGESGWNVPADKLKNLFMYAPTDFVGVMDSAVDLRGPDQKLIDRRRVKLEWVEPKQKPVPVTPPPAAAPAPPPDAAAVPPPAPNVAPAVNASAPPAMSAEVVASLLQRGQDYLKNGDIASARIVFGRLAAAGVADGAFAAGQSYDTAYLSAHNVFGVSGDEARARDFYQRAAQLGSADAAAQLAKAASAK